MRHSKLKSELAIASPCTQPWDAMIGTATKRHCESCQKQVHNFAVMTPRQIDRTIADNEGHLCARITRRTDGSLVTANELQISGFSAKAASFVLGAALSAGVAYGQSTNPESKAIVSGRFTAPNGGPPPAQGYVIFASEDESKLEVKTDHDGNWSAEITPGTYDVIFRTNVIFGERVNSVQLHAGAQQFTDVHGRIAFGHLGLVDLSTNDTYTTMGEVVMTMSYRYRIRYLFKHPVRYVKSLRHIFT